MRAISMIALILVACGGQEATAPSAWILDVTPFPSTLKVGDKVTIHVVAMDLSAITRFDVSNVQVTSSNPLALKVSGDTLIALGTARIDLKLTGTLDARTVTGQRTIIVLPAPAEVMLSRW